MMNDSQELLSETAFDKVMSKRPIYYYDPIGVAIGVTNAICWQQVNYWCKKENNKNIFEGRRWVYNTYAQWHERIQSLSEITIKRSFLQLEKMGLILTKRINGVKYYTTDSNAMQRLLESGIESTYQNDTLQEDTSYQNDTTTVSKRYDDRIKMIRSYIDTKNTHRLHKEVSKEENASLSSSSHPQEDVPPTSRIKKIVKEEKLKATRIPEDWDLTDEQKERSILAGMPREVLKAEIREFKRFWKAAAQNDKKRCWYSVWQTKVKNYCGIKGLSYNDDWFESETDIAPKPVETVSKQIETPKEHYYHYDFVSDLYHYLVADKDVCWHLPEYFRSVSQITLISIGDGKAVVWMNKHHHDKYLKDDTDSEHHNLMANRTKDIITTALQKFDPEIKDRHSLEIITEADTCPSA